MVIYEAVNGVSLCICMFERLPSVISRSFRHALPLVHHTLGHCRQLAGAEQSSWPVLHGLLAWAHLRACRSGRWLWGVNVISETQVCASCEKAHVDAQNLQRVFDSSFLCPAFSSFFISWPCKLVTKILQHIKKYIFWQSN